MTISNIFQSCQKINVRRKNRGQSAFCALVKDFYPRRPLMSLCFVDVHLSVKYVT